MNRAILKLHRDATVVLGYVNPGLIYRHHPDGVSAHDFIAGRPGCGQGTVWRMRKGGVDLVVLSHGNIDPKRFPDSAEVDYMLRCFDALITEIKKSPDLQLILTKSDLDYSIQKKKFGVLLHLGGMPINNSLAVLRMYQRLGIRGAHPFVSDLKIGGEGYGSPRVGLKPWGRAIIREMERLSILVDLTHTNDRTFAQVMRMVKKPVIDSHTCCRALARVYRQRNRTDEQMRLIAQTGGVIGVHFSSAFIEKMRLDESQKYKRLIGAFRKKLARMERKFKDPYEFISHRWDPWEWSKALGGAVADGIEIRRTTIARLVDHLEHIAEVAGINHVGIGSDYDLGDTCGGVETADKLPNLTAELVQRGYQKEEIRKILGGNFLRVFRQCLPEYTDAHK
ncbi:MAG: membrane dipeptidase [Verrucomicrobia bacterium]|nr:membrane dipeptidase [Verrucomicrobiota bacterium]